MRNPRLAGLIAIGLLLGAAACGGDDDDIGDTSEISSELVNTLGLSDEQAQCVIDELGSDASVILELADEDFTPSEDDVVALDRAGDECGLE